MRLTVYAVLALSAFALAACGDEESTESSVPPTTTTTTEAPPDAKEIGEAIEAAAGFDVAVDYLDPNGDGGDTRSSAITAVGDMNVVIEVYASTYLANGELRVIEEKDRASAVICGEILATVAEVTPQGGIASGETQATAEEIYQALDREFGPC